MDNNTSTKAATPTTTGTTKKSVNFATPVEETFWFEGVTEEERDDVWFRRTDYVEFVEAELRRRELLTEIESGKRQRRASDTDKCSEAAMTHTFTRRMVSRTFSAGPNVRRRRLPRREKNELDVSNHSSSFSKKRQQLRQKQQQQQQSNAQQPQQQQQQQKQAQQPTPITTVKAMAASVEKIKKAGGPSAVQKEPMKSTAAVMTTNKPVPQPTKTHTSPVCDSTLLLNDALPPPATPIEKIEPGPAITGTTSPPQALTV